MLQELVRAVLVLIDGLLHLIVRPNPYRISYFSVPDYTDNAYYMYRHLLQTRPDIEHVWLLRDNKESGRIETELLQTSHAPSVRFRTANKNSLRGYLLYLTSTWTFHTHGVYRFSRSAFRGRHVICLWHGMPIKAIGRLGNNRGSFGTMHVATSPLFRYIIAHAMDVEPDRVAISGLPRCDALQFDSSRSKAIQDVRAFLGVADEEKLVVWLPTYRVQVQPWAVPRSKDADVPLAVDERRSFLDDLPDGFLSAVDDAAGSSDCRVVLKLHPLDALNFSSRDVSHANIRMIRSDEWIASGIQLYDMLAASDGLISDVSSVIIDYSATNKPIALMGFVQENYERDLLLPMEMFTESDRFESIDTTDAVLGFFRDVKDGLVKDRVPRDVSSTLYDEFSEPSAELIAREVDL